MKAPKQARSQETYERILAAAREIMLTREYESVSVEEICEHAGLTTGAFYGRFSNKATLLAALSERTNAHIQTLFGAIEEWGSEERTLEERVTRFIQDLDSFYVEYRGVLRSIRRSAAANPVLQERAASLNLQMKERVIEFMRPNMHEIKHRDKVAALEVALTIIYSTLRMQSVENDLFPQGFDVPKSQLLPALSSSILCYLTQRP